MNSVILEYVGVAIFIPALIAVGRRHRYQLQILTICVALLAAFLFVQALHTTWELTTVGLLAVVSMLPAWSLLVQKAGAAGLVSAGVVIVSVPVYLANFAWSCWRGMDGVFPVPDSARARVPEGAEEEAL